MVKINPANFQTAHNYPNGEIADLSYPTGLPEGCRKSGFLLPALLMRHCGEEQELKRSQKEARILTATWLEAIHMAFWQ